MCVSVLHCLLGKGMSTGACSRVFNSMLDGLSKETLSNVDTFFHRHPLLQPPWLPRPLGLCIFGIAYYDESSPSALSVIEDATTHRHGVRRIPGRCIARSGNGRSAVLEHRIRRQGVVAAQSQALEAHGGCVVYDNRVQCAIPLTAVRITPTLSVGSVVHVVAYDVSCDPVCFLPLRRRKCDFVTWDVDTARIRLCGAPDNGGLVDIINRCTSGDSLPGIDLARRVCVLSCVSPRVAYARLHVEPPRGSSHYSSAFDYECVYVNAYFRGPVHGIWYSYT